MAQDANGFASGNVNEVNLLSGTPIPEEKSTPPGEPERRRGFGMNGTANGTATPPQQPQPHAAHPNGPEEEPVNKRLSWKDEIRKLSPA